MFLRLRHCCLLCGRVGDEVAIKKEKKEENEKSLQEDSYEVEVVKVNEGPLLPPPKKCSVSQCGRYYHEACLLATPLWPQARLSPLVCPAHTCHTCASDNPKDPVMKFSGKLATCLRCPTSYHYGDTCVSAGTIQVTKADIVCHKHWKPRRIKKKGGGANHGKVININWCFDCGGGGSLVCCELCPMSVHPECRRDKKQGMSGENKFYCDNCTDGKMPLYNDLVWVKLGAYR